MGIFRRIMRIGVKFGEAVFPGRGEIGPGVVAVDRIGEGRDQNAEIGLARTPRGTDEERDRILMPVAVKAHDIGA